MEFTWKQMQLIGRKLAELDMAETEISKPFNDEFDRLRANGDKVGAAKLVGILESISQIRSEELLQEKHTHRPFSVIRAFVRDFIRYGYGK